MITWNVLTGSTVSYTASVNNGYINMSDDGVQITLPATAAVGDVVKFINNSGSSGNQWYLIPNSGQQVSVTTDADYTTTSGTGSVAEFNIYSAAELVCVVADTKWIIVSYTGPASLTVS